MLLQSLRPSTAFIRSRGALSRLYHADKVATLGSQPDTQSPEYQVGQKEAAGWSSVVYPNDRNVLVLWVPEVDVKCSKVELTQHISFIRAKYSELKVFWVISSFEYTLSF